MENQHGQRRFVTVLFLLRWDAGGAWGGSAKEAQIILPQSTPACVELRKLQDGFVVRLRSQSGFDGKKRLVDFESF